MSKERKSSAESDEQTNEDSDSVLQREDNVRRAKLTSLSDTTLQDLPIEMLERILVQVVVMEVKDMKMAKSVWKDKAALVINRLTTICSHWSSILTTDDFRNEVNRVIDGTAQEESRLEIVYQYPLPCKVSKVTTNKDEIFMLCKHAHGDLDRVINVYDRNNMAEVKDVIMLPRRNAKAIEGCVVSNCLYVRYIDSPGISMLRITRDDEHHQFNISPWISDYKLSLAKMSVSTNGNVVITSTLENRNRVLVSIYDKNGFFQHKVELLPNIKNVASVVQKSDGNLVVVASNERLVTKLMEIDARGNILREYQSALCEFFVVWLTDSFGRILLSSSSSKTELVDCEFNRLDIAGLPLDEEEYIGQWTGNERLHSNRARNEMVGVVYGKKFENGALTLFRLT